MEFRLILQQFNDTIGQWIDFLDDYTLEMLCRPPQPTSWSLGQVYIHITNDTKYFVERMREALLTNDNSDKTMHENARWMFRQNGFPDRLIEGPATNTYIPQPQSKSALSQALAAIRNEVNALAPDLERSGSTGKTEHPGLHFFTALEWLQFAEMHMRHHFRQKKRIDVLLLNIKPI